MSLDDVFRMPVQLGRVVQTWGQPAPNQQGGRLYLPPSVFPTHCHFIGATGSGKTTALETILYTLFMDDVPGRSFFIIDPLGPFSQRLLRFLANRDYCSDAIRRRVVYFEPADERYATTLHPLRYDSRQHLDYQVARAIDLILRGFDAQNVEVMPRLRLWLHRAFLALSLLGHPLSIAKYLLNPRLEEHPYLIAQLPRGEQAEWIWLMQESRGEAVRILESTRNRLSLLSDYIVLQPLFSSTTNRFDVGQFMDEGRIVIINLCAGPQRLNHHAASTIGSLLINEVGRPIPAVRRIPLAGEKVAPT